MCFLRSYNKKIIKYDLINKFLYNNSRNIAELKKITLNFGCKNFNIQRFALTFLALEIISSKKSSLSVSRKSSVMLQIQKGQPAGCIAVLQKKNMDKFLTKLHLQIMPKFKNFLGIGLQLKTSSFSFKLPHNKIILPEFENQYPLFLDLPDLNIHILTNTKKRNELLFLLKATKFHFFAKKKLIG